MQANIYLEKKARGRLQAELQIIPKSLYAAFMALDEAFLLIDQKLRVVLINDKAKEIGGFANGFVCHTGDCILDLFPVKDRSLLKNLLLKVLKGETVDYEIEIKPHDKKPIWLKCTYKPLQDDYNTVGICALLKDITFLKELEKEEERRKSAEKNHSESKQLFETFMENTPLTAWITDTRGMMQYLNPTFRRTYNIPFDDQLRSMSDIFPAHLVDEYISNNNAAIEAGKLIEIIEKTIKPDGRLGVYKVFKFPMQIGDQKMIGGWSVEITEEIKLQQKLTDSIERYAYVNEATSDAIYDWDVTTNIIYRGKGFFKLFGFHPPFDSLDIRLSLVHPEDLPLVKKMYTESLTDSTVSRWNFEFRFKDVEGHYKNVMDRAFIIREGDRAVRVIGALQDITEYKLLQDKILLQEKTKKRAIVRSVIETQEKERRQLSVELHDNVNQILSSCKLMLEVAKENRDNSQNLTEKSYQSLQLAIAEIRKISHELNPSTVEDFGLKEAVGEMIDKINLSGKIFINFSYKENKKKKELKSEDKIAAYRIVQEQVSNILKHSGAKNVLLRIGIKPEEINLVIEDDGIGFDPQKINKGIGLKNIHHRVEYYRGTMHIKTGKNKGCRLSVQLNIGEKK